LLLHHYQPPVLDEGELSATRFGHFFLPETAFRFSLPSELAVPQTRSGRYGIQINLFPLPSMEPRFLGCINRIPDTVLITLCRLPIHCTQVFNISTVSFVSRKPFGPSGDAPASGHGIAASSQ